MSKIYRVYEHAPEDGIKTYRIVYISGRQVFEVERLLPKTVQRFIDDMKSSGNIATIYNLVYEGIETVYGNVNSIIYG